MSILLTKDIRVIVQGMTGREGQYHTGEMLKYGTKVVAGVTPGKQGQMCQGLPVFSNCVDAVRETGANASVLFVPAPFVKNAVFDAINAGIGMIVCITEGIPLQDMIQVMDLVKEKNVHFIGPNCPGLASPGIGKMGIIPSPILKEGSVGVISRSGTLTYELLDGLKKKNIGQTTCVGIGGDPILGLTFSDLIVMFEDDPETKLIVMIGEIGGTDEENAASVIATVSKPVLCFISGKTAPPGKKMGHAGAIISAGQGTVESKEKALLKSGAILKSTTDELVNGVVELLN